MLEKISNECYRPLIALFRRHPEIRATVNLNGILLDQLEREGGKDIVRGFRELATSGQWEVVGSSKHHVIIPLVPGDEVVRQFRLQKESLRTYLGVEKTRGFFPPEMCLDATVLPTLRLEGVEWIIASGTSCPEPWPVDFVSRDPGSGIRILFRDDVISNRISFDRFAPEDFVSTLRTVKPLVSRKAYLVIGMDAETYGHHIPGWDKEFLEKAFKLIETDTKNPRIKTSTLSEIIDEFGTNTVDFAPKASSWSTSPEDERRGVPFPLWDDPANPFHRLQWEHIRLAKRILDMGEAVSHLGEAAARHYGDARHLMDMAYHSCQFWWASRRPLAGVDLILKGLWLQKEVIAAASRAIQAVPGHDNQKAGASMLRSQACRIAAEIEELLATTP